MSGYFRQPSFARSIYLWRPDLTSGVSYYSRLNVSQHQAWTTDSATNSTTGPVLQTVPLVVLQECSHHSLATGTQLGACVHTRSMAPGRSGTVRPPRDVIAVERDRTGSSWLRGVNAQPDTFRSLLASSCVILQQYSIHLAKDCLSDNKST